MICQFLNKGRQAKSQCNPSSREINSFENVNPALIRVSLTRKMERELPEKNIPSNSSKSNKSFSEGSIPYPFNSPFSFLPTHGSVSIE